MSTQHEPITVKPISEVAKFQRNLIPANIPNAYALNPIFEETASEENIRSGVVAFRDFLYLFCDNLITDGHLYAKPPNKPGSMADYPFLHNITNLLVDIGYHGKLASSGDSLLITRLPLCAATTDMNGKKTPPKIPASSQLECMRFLALCGFVFTGIDLNAKASKITGSQMFEVSYPANPIMLTGLKAMSIADMELRTGRRYWNDNNLLRCDYRLLKAEESDMREVLHDFLHPLPDKAQDFALKLHQRYTDMGLTCVNTRLGLVSFAYAHLGKSRKTLSERDIYGKRVWEFSYAIKNGYCLYVRPKRTEKYADIIKTLHMSLQDKIAQGYGCDKKRGERCQHGCQGICIPLDDSILDLAKDIEIWLDNEVPVKYDA